MTCGLRQDIDIDLDNPNITLARLTNNKVPAISQTPCFPFFTEISWGPLQTNNKVPAISQPRFPNPRAFPPLLKFRGVLGLVFLWGPRTTVGLLGPLFLWER